MTKACTPLGSPRLSPQKKKHKRHNLRTPIHERSPANSSVNSLKKFLDISDQSSSISNLSLSSLIFGLLLAIILAVYIYFQLQTTMILSSDYTLCKQTGSTTTTCQSYIDDQMSIDKQIDNPCKCTLNFTLDKDIYTDKVAIYYGLVNFNQNFRFLVQSRHYRQLSGKMRPQEIPHSCASKDNRTIYPCGQMANLMFDDEFTISYEGGNQTLDLNRCVIVQEDSRGHIYKNPPNISKQNYSKPRRWFKDPFVLDQSDASNNGIENGPFIVWMSTSTFDYFVKLYALVAPPNGKLMKGQYKIVVDYRYGVYKANARKLIRIETVGGLGVKNNTFFVVLSCLSIMYILLFIFIASVVLRRWASLVQVHDRVP